MLNDGRTTPGFRIRFCSAPDRHFATKWKMPEQIGIEGHRIRLDSSTTEPQITSRLSLSPLQWTQKIEELTNNSLPSICGIIVPLSLNTLYSVWSDQDIDQWWIWFVPQMSCWKVHELYVLVDRRQRTSVCSLLIRALYRTRGKLRLFGWSCSCQSSSSKFIFVFLFVWWEHHLIAAHRDVTRSLLLRIVNLTEDPTIAMLEWFLTGRIPSAPVWRHRWHQHCNEQCPPSIQFDVGRHEGSPYRSLSACQRAAQEQCHACVSFHL